MFQKATDGPLVGYPTVPVDIPYLLRLTAEAMAVPVTYEMGGKAPNVLVTPLGTSRIDCSGWARYALYHATHGVLLMPDGSWNQADWLLAQGFKRTDPGNCALCDGHVRVNVHTPDSKDWTGHIWIVPGDGLTSESHGGKGVDRRAWDAMLGSGYRLNDIATYCFVLC